MKNKTLKTILSFAGIILLFLFLSYAFVPQVLSGKIVNQSDISGWTGMTNEVVSYNEAHPDDTALWTNSMFGGMPTISMYGDFKGDWTSWIYNLLLAGARPATYFFISLLGGFLLMTAFGMNWILAVGGAIAITFCSYNMQIIQVGHNTKMQAIAFMPWVLAALAYTYRSALSAMNGRNRKWLFASTLGSVLFAFALSFQIKSNHPQISYYLAIIILVYVISLFIWLVSSAERRKRLARFFIASAMLLVFGCIGIATNLNKLLPTYEYTEYSMRGGTELDKGQDASGNKGLDLGYATAWSYGIEETPNLLIPDFNGGSSAGELSKKSETYELLRRAGQPNLNSVIKSMPLYWGPQPFTAGPMYIGAISIFLFILGLILLKGKEKWWLAITTLLAIFLAWGSHFMWFTKLWFDYVPLYNKFRTVSMALTILQITVPLLGFMALDHILKGEYRGKNVRKAGLIAYAIAGGFCLICAIFPGIAGDFVSSADAGQPQVLAGTLAADRQALLVKDAWTSFAFISIAFLLILWAFRTKEPFVNTGRLHIICGIISILVLVDLGTVGKRYLNESHFVSRHDFSSQFKARPVDEFILQDKTLDYRVLDLSVNTFNDAHPSYWHKCIGGYSPAKLQRYQDLIERHLTREIRSIYGSIGNAGTLQEMEEKLPETPILSMLNGKYIIVDPEFPALTNRNAYGNCWFVTGKADAATPDEEISLIGNTDLRKNAVIGKDFSWAAEKISGLSEDIPASDYVEMTGYAPHRLEYSCNLTEERAVVFSEVYYPKGWKASIDGKPVDLFRADWLLRGAILPAGQYEFTMEFQPQSYKTGERISRAASITLLLLLLLSGGGMALTARKDE